MNVTNNVKLERKVLLKIAIYILGMIVGCCGTSLLTVNALGSDAMNTFFVAIATKLNVRSGDVYTVFNSIMLIAGFLLARSYMGIGSLVQILIQGFFLNLWMMLFESAPWLFEGIFFKALMAIAAYICRSLGNALSNSVYLGIAGFEACLFALADRIKVEYKYLKMLSEVLFFAGAFFLDGVFGIMTIVSVFLYGHGVSFFMLRLDRGPWKKWGISDERNDLARNNRWKQARRVS